MRSICCWSCRPSACPVPRRTAAWTASSHPALCALCGAVMLAGHENFSCNPARRTCGAQRDNVVETFLIFACFSRWCSSSSSAAAAAAPAIESAFCNKAARKQTDVFAPERGRDGVRNRGLRQTTTPFGWSGCAARTGAGGRSLHSDAVGARRLVHRANRL